MIVELHGGKFENRGAQKMLRTAMSRLAERIPGISFAVDACVGQAAERDAANLATIFVSRGWMGNRWFVPKFSAQRFGGRFASQAGRTALQQCDALVDLSGFAFTDQWGSKSTADAARLFSYYAGAGKPVILLPQALGPFRTSKIRMAFRQLSGAATRIYARDERSLDQAREVDSRAPLFLCPDMTIAEGVRFADAATERPVFLVPNERLLDQGGVSLEAYLANTSSLLTQLKRDAAVSILVHDSTGGDAALAKALAERVPGGVPVETVSDPFAAKEKLASASLVIGSRYHALVAALSCGVPVLAQGWAHKYDQLMSDYGRPEHAFPADADPGALLALARHLLADAVNRAERDAMRQISMAQSVRVEQMWDAVAELLLRTRAE